VRVGGLGREGVGKREFPAQESREYDSMSVENRRFSRASSRAGPCPAASLKLVRAPRSMVMSKILNNKWIYGIGSAVVAGLILNFLSGIGKSAPGLTVDSSPNSINTLNQNGSNSITVNELAPKPEIEIRKIKSINTKTENGYLHTYILTLSNPANEDVNIAASAAKNINFKLLDFGYQTDSLVLDKGKTLTDLDAWVLTDKEVTETDIGFVLLEK